MIEKREWGTMKKQNWLMGLAVAMLAATVLTGCGGTAEKKQEPVAQKEPTELFISAAASLTDVMKEIAALYNKAHPDLKLTFSFGASGALQKQIEQGAPADLFFSAAEKQMDALEKGGELLENTRKDLLLNQVVLIAPPCSKAQLKGFEDVRIEPIKKIALGEPKGVPVGQYAQEIFTSMHCLDQVKAKAVYGSDVRQVLTWVESGEADCGVVYATDAAISKKIKVVSAAPEGSHKPVIYPAAVIKSSKNADAAKAFLAFVQKPEIAKIFEKYGFKVK